MRKGARVNYVFLRYIDPKVPSRMCTTIYFRPPHFLHSTHLVGKNDWRVCSFLHNNGYENDGFCSGHKLLTKNGSILVKAYLGILTLALQKAVLSPSSFLLAFLLSLLLKEKPQSAKFALLRSDKSQYGHDLRQGKCTWHLQWRSMHWRKTKVYHNFYCNIFFFSSCHCDHFIYEVHHRLK